MNLQWSKNIFGWGNQQIVRLWWAAWRKSRAFAFFVFGRNPYPEGSVGSLRWKIKRNRPLNQQEKREISESAEQVAAALRMVVTTDARYHIAYLNFASQLLDNLPRQLRDDLDATPLNAAGTKIEQLLALASYERERGSGTLARCALVVSVLALLITVGTLAVTVWVRFNPNCTS